MPGWMITGGSGFLGRHLSAAFGPGCNVTTIGRKPPGQGLAAGSFVRADIGDAEALTRVVGRIAPEVVIHLAGQTPPASPDSLYRSNVLGTLHLLDALRSLGQPVRLVLAGSAAELGPVEVDDLPVGEQYPCQPIEAYGLSKWLATCAGAGGEAADRGDGRAGLQPDRARHSGLSGVGPVRGDPGRWLGARPAEGRRPRSVSRLRRRPGCRAGLRCAGRERPGRPGLPRRDWPIAPGGRWARPPDRVERAGRHGRGRPELRPIPRAGDSRADVSRIARDVGWSAEIPWEQSLRDLWDDACRRSRSG